MFHVPIYKNDVFYYSDVSIAYVELREILEEVVKGRTEVLSELQDDLLKEMILDTFKAINEPELIRDKYLQKLNKSQPIQNFDLNKLSDEEEFAHNIFAFSVLLRTKVRLGEIDPIDKLTEIIVYIESQVLEYSLSALSEKTLFCLGYFFDKIFHFHWYKGKHQRAIYYGTIAISVYQKIGYKILEYTLRGNLVDVMRYFKPLRFVLQEFTEIQTYYSKNDFHFFSLLLKTNICEIQFLMGDINEALENLEKVLEEISFHYKNTGEYLGQEMEAIRLRGNSYFLLGIIYNAIGNYEKSNEYLNEGIHNFKIHSHDDLGYARMISELGYSHYLSGKFNEAKELFEEAIEIFQQIGHNTDLSEVLFRLILLTIEEKSDITDLLSRYEELEVSEIKERKETRLMYLRAYSKYRKNNALEKFEALDIFVDLLQEYNLSYYLELNVRSHIIHLLLMDLMVTYSEEKIQKLEAAIKYLLDMANENNVYKIIMDVTIKECLVYEYKGEKSKVYERLSELRNELVNNNLEHLITQLDHVTSLFHESESKSPLSIYNQINTLLMVKFQDSSTDYVKSVDKHRQSRNVQRYNLIEKPYETILSPIRLSIVRLLDYNEELNNAEIQDNTNIPQSTLSRHLQNLEESHIVESEIQLVGSRPTKVYKLTTHGIQLYRNLRTDLLQD